MITKDKLEDYAKKLMFEMNDEEYKTLEEEFEIIAELIDYRDEFGHRELIVIARKR